MDIQKENEAFEAYEFAKRPFASKKVMFQKYDSARIGDCDGNEGKYYDVQIQEKWEIWLHVKKQAVLENNWEEMYRCSIINAKKRKNQLNWAHVTSLGVGSAKAVEMCKYFKIDPSATDMRQSMIEAAEVP